MGLGWGIKSHIAAEITPEANANCLSDGWGLSYRNLIEVYLLINILVMRYLLLQHRLAMRLRQRWLLALGKLLLLNS